MFKKFTALLLLTAITNVYAISPLQPSEVNSELNRTFDSLNYKLNVEWNQKDAQFFDASVAEFEKEISGLQSAGVTNQDLIKYTTENIKDKLIQNDIMALSNLVAESQMTNEEARAFVVSKLNSTYSHGASWSGSRVGLHAAFFVAAIIVTIIIINNRDDDCKKKRHHGDDFLGRGGPRGCESFSFSGNGGGYGDRCCNEY